MKFKAIMLCAFSFIRLVGWIVFSALVAVFIYLSYFVFELAAKAFCKGARGISKYTRIMYDITNDEYYHGLYEDVHEADDYLTKIMSETK